MKPKGIMHYLHESDVQPDLPFEKPKWLTDAEKLMPALFKPAKKSNPYCIYRGELMTTAQAAKIWIDEGLIEDPRRG